jgi:hypothetical protein
MKEQGMNKIIGLGLVALSLTTVMTDQTEDRLFRRHRGGCNTCHNPCNSYQAPQGMYDPNAPQGMYYPNAPQLNPNAPQPNYAPPAAPQPIQPGNPT